MASNRFNKITKEDVKALRNLTVTKVGSSDLLSSVLNQDDKDKLTSLLLQAIDNGHGQTVNAILRKNIVDVTHQHVIRAHYHNFQTIAKDLQDYYNSKNPNDKLDMAFNYHNYGLYK